MCGGSDVSSMKAVVIGGGVVGVTTAYYLAKGGHEVTVVERESDVATGASAGNAGLIAPSHSFGWASPTAPMELLRSLTVEDTALRVNPFKAPSMAAWGSSSFGSAPPNVLGRTRLSSCASPNTASASSTRSRRPRRSTTTTSTRDCFTCTAIRSEWKPASKNGN